MITRRLRQNRIGKDTFQRKDEGKWKKLKKSGNPLIEVIPTKPEVQTQLFQFLGKEIINGEETNVYQETSSYSFGLERFNFKVEGIAVDKYWFNDLSNMRWAKKKKRIRTRNPVLIMSDFTISMWN